MVKSFAITSILVLGIVIGLGSMSWAYAQDAQQDYIEFSNCLTDAEIGGAGVVTEQQIEDCFDSVYGQSDDGTDDGDDDNGSNSGDDDGDSNVGNSGSTSS